jgi:hypothetical protein
MAFFIGSKWECDTWPNQRPPCVTCLFVKTFSLSKSRPRDLQGKGKALGKAAQPAHPRMFLVMYMGINIFNIVVIYVWMWVGLRLSPDPWSCVILYATSTTVVTTITIYYNHLLYVYGLAYHVTTIHACSFDIWFRRLFNIMPCCVGAWSYDCHVPTGLGG